MPASADRLEVGTNRPGRLGSGQAPAVGCFTEIVDLGPRKPTNPSPPTASQAVFLYALAFGLLYFLWLPLQRRDLVLGLLASEWGGLFGLVVLFAAHRAAFAARPGRRSPGGPERVGSGGHPERMGEPGAQRSHRTASAQPDSHRRQPRPSGYPGPGRADPGHLRGSPVPRPHSARAARADRPRGSGGFDWASLRRLSPRAVAHPAHCPAWGPAFARRPSKRIDTSRHARPFSQQRHLDRAGLLPGRRTGC